MELFTRRKYLIFRKVSDILTVTRCLIYWKVFLYRGYFILDYMYFMQVKNLLQISRHFIPQKFPKVARNKAA